MKVILSDKFQEHLPKFDDEKRQAVMDFVAYVSVNGLKNLAGRNKSSVPVNPHTKNSKPTLPTPKNIVYGITILVYLNMWANMAI